MKQPAHHPLQAQTRRHFFQECGGGLGKIALASLLTRELTADTPELPAFRLPIRAKRIIYLFQAGAPSQLDLFDYKPKLKELEGKPLPPSVIKGQRYAFIRRDASNSPGTGNAAPSSPTGSPTWQKSSTTSPSSRPSTRTSSTTRPRSSS